MVWFWWLSPLLIYFLTFHSFFLDEVSAQQNFIGFRAGQTGFGVGAGWPTFSLRYQTWSTWKRAWFYNLAYDNEGFVVLSVDHSFYLYDAQDRWRETGAFSSAFFYAYLGGLYGYSVNPGVESRLGVDGGVGLEYILPDPEWTFRIEAGSSLHVLGKEAASLHLGLGVIYYFDLGIGRRRRTPQQRLLDNAR